MTPSPGRSRIAYPRLAVLLALAIVLSMAEALLLPPLGVPGAKWGLANIISLLVLLTFGFRAALVIAVVRVTLVSLLLGTFLGLGFWLSLGGGFFSAIVMGLALRLPKFGLLGVSILGATAHNLAQLAVYALVMGSTGIFYLLPPLLGFALLTGSITGMVVQRLRQY